jgi:hypothetical protein
MEHSTPLTAASKPLYPRCLSRFIILVWCRQVPFTCLVVLDVFWLLISPVCFLSQQLRYLLLLGEVLNRDYKLAAKAHNIVIDELRGDDLSKFPIEKARLRSVWFFVILCAICIAGYGWSVNKKIVRFPLFCLFDLGWVRPNH